MRSDGALYEQVIHHNLPLHHTAVLSVGNAVCRHHRQMNGLLGTERSLQRLYTHLYLFRFVFVNGVCGTGKLHLTGQATVESTAIVGEVR